MLGRLVIMSASIYVMYYCRQASTNPPSPPAAAAVAATTTFGRSRCCVLSIRSRLIVAFKASKTQLARHHCVGRVADAGRAETTPQRAAPAVALDRRRAGRGRREHECRNELESQSHTLNQGRLTHSKMKGETQQRHSRPRQCCQSDNEKERGTYATRCREKENI